MKSKIGIIIGREFNERVRKKSFILSTLLTPLFMIGLMVAPILISQYSEENKKQFFIPKGFAHGFLVLSDFAEFAYKCTDFYHPNDEGGLLYNDPEIGVEWPIPEGMELIMSEKDQKWGGLSSLKK